MVESIEKVLKSEILRQIDLEQVVSVEKSTSIGATLDKMKSGLKIKSAVVVDKAKPTGLLTVRNIMNRLALSDVSLNEPVEKIMTKNPETLTLESTLWESLGLLNQEVRRTLPIVDKDGKVVGVVTARALVNYVAAHFPMAIYNLPPDPQKVSQAPDGA